MRARTKPEQLTSDVSCSGGANNIAVDEGAGQLANLESGQNRLRRVSGCGWTTTSVRDASIRARLRLGGPRRRRRREVQ